VIVVPAFALARIPEALSAAEAAPMGCAGVTVFNALRRSAARPGDLVAVLGLGGLGHLGVQCAAKMGFDDRRHRPRARAVQQPYPPTTWRR
jgi:alcohol dehydrogenase